MDRSFTRMSNGRHSVEPSMSQAARLLQSFTGSDIDIDDDIPAANFVYDPTDPWSSPRGPQRETTPPLPRHNFCPGLSELAAKVRQRSIYTGNFKMSRREGYYFERVQASIRTPSRVDQLVSRARSLSSLGFDEAESRTSRMQIKPKPQRLPKIQTTPRLERKLKLLESNEGQGLRRRR
eukprot:COSAG05_NODE_1040_length_6068_cov_46.397219_3_plen_179_part_00